MRNFVIVVMLLSVIYGCNKDQEFGKGILIKGTLPKKSKSSQVSLLEDAKKVLVFSKDYYELYDIVDGAFTVTGKLGTGIALIFLDANNKYIGNLSSRGLNVLPLGNLIDGENTSIDLSQLTLNGNSVTPAHDPLGNEIIVSESEIKSLKVIGAFYESIAKNIDADNDGILDVLSNKQIYTSTLFARYSGHWGYNETAPVLSDSSASYINYSLNINGGIGLYTQGGDIKLSGPNHDPYEEITTWGYYITDREFSSSFVRQAPAPPGAPWGTSFLPFQKGTYTLTLGNNTYTIDYSNLDAYVNLTIICPTLHTDESGKLTSISFEYKLPDGTNINPASIITNVMIQCVDNQYHQFISGKNLTIDTGFTQMLFDNPVDISMLYQIDIWYDDLLGNKYDIIWQ